MKLYFAGAEAGEFTDLLNETGIECVLFSYYYLENPKDLKKFDDVFLDSGGYTARVQGEEISVEEYICFIKTIEKEITHYANLDTADQKESEENLKKMEGEGLNPLPVWHSGWSQDLLKHYLNSYEYLALGGIAGQGFNEDKKYNEIVRATNLDGDAKLHLFGTTSPKILKMTRDKIYSADSTSWLNGGKYGRFYQFKKGELRNLIPKKFEEKYNRAFNELTHRQMNKWNLTQWKKYADYLKSEKK